MLGVQENRTDGSLPARTYRCMACAATFPGLSSLLVHQASHANDNTPDSLQPLAESSQEACSTCGSTVADKELRNRHQCNAAESSASASVYICECGFDFEDVNSMNEHRKSHGVDVQVKTLEAGTNNASKISNPSRHGSTSSSNNQSFDAVSRSVPVLLVCPPFHQFSTKHSDAKMPEKQAENVVRVSQLIESPSLPIHVASQGSIQHTDPSSSNSVPGSEVSEHEQKEVPSPKKTLKKLLVSAFMERLPPAQTSWKPNEEHGLTKAAAPEASVGPPPSLASSVQQLRRLLTKSASKTKVATTKIPKTSGSSAASAGEVGNTVNLNDAFLPVVALETRQKLLGVSRDAQEGRHQCGFCRRVFQHVDNLILHHAVHKKDKIFGCRRCKQLLISKVPVPLHHVCPPGHASAKRPFSVGVVLPSSLGRLAGSSQKVSLEGSCVKVVQKRLFFCHLCKHSFTRLYNLKKHKCQWFSHRSAHSRLQKEDVKDDANCSKKTVVAEQESKLCNSVASGTEAPSVKWEHLEAGPTHTVLTKPQDKSCTWPGSPKSFLPFISKMSVKNSLATDAQNAVKAEEEDKEAGASAREGEKQGQWTVPIDESEMYRLAETDNKEDVCLMKTPGGQSSSSTQNGSLSPLPPNSALPNTSEAVEKRFVCRHCGKSYTRRFSLNQHLKSCQRPVSAAVLQDAEKWLPVQLHEGRPSFECVQCGKSFSRRYNLVLHRKRYHSTSTAEAAAASHSGTEPTRTSAGPTRDASQDYVSQKRMLILPPPPEDQDGGARSKSTTAAGDWGIMSLPSVLPRKVTCECGSVFTCPRMLFEHLRMHAQESFICPQCGEDFHSWLSYESHLRSHRRSVCSNCQQTFSLHSSLVRHLTKNRCKANFPKGKKFICSHCSLELPNYPSLSLHMQNCQHNPSAKLIRCSTCSRGFSSRDALQRHLFTHSHTNAFRCLLCQRGYPSLQSLKDHQRKVHRIKAVQAK